MTGPHPKIKRKMKRIHARRMAWLAKNPELGKSGGNQFLKPTESSKRRLRLPRFGEILAGIAGKREDT